MSYLIAPDKFKGTLPAQEVGRIVGEVAREQDPDAQVDILSIADGGEGTAALLAGNSALSQKPLIRWMRSAGRYLLNISFRKLRLFLI